jgi:glutaconate CoA-transferase subunit A
MSLHDAVAKYVQSGDTICFGGFTTNRKPYAVMGEILRQGQTDFTVWAGPAGGDWDMMIGEGRVKAYINCYTANSGYTNVSRRFRAAIEGGKLTYEDYSQDVLMLQLHAASLGLPYLPVRLMQGSGLCEYWGISPEKRAELPSVDNLKFAYVDNPFNPGEKVVAVPVPRLDCAIIHVQQASPDGTCVIMGDEFHDIDIAVAGKRVIVTCEEIVSDEYIRQNPEKNKIFGECVDAVVRCPYGAWPSQCYGYYDDDDAALKEYDKASNYVDEADAVAKLAKAAGKARKAADFKPGDPKLEAAAVKAEQAAKDAADGVKFPETFKDYLNKWVYSCKDQDDLLDKIGGHRLMNLRIEPHLGYSTRH